MLLSLQGATSVASSVNIVTVIQKTKSTYILTNYLKTNIWNREKAKHDNSVKKGYKSKIKNDKMPFLIYRTVHTVYKAVLCRVTPVCVHWNQQEALFISKLLICSRLNGGSIFKIKIYLILSSPLCLWILTSTEGTLFPNRFSGFCGSAEKSKMFFKKQNHLERVEFPQYLLK